MLLKVFTLRFDSRLEGFDDTVVREFVKDKDVVSVRDHFFLKDDAPYWSFLVTYNVAARDGEPAGAGTRPEGRTDYRSTLAEAEWALFNWLRDWRRERSNADGVPPYLVLTNEILAEVARRRPTTLNELSQLCGFGPGKLRRYGKEVLGRLQSWPRERSQPEAPAPPQPEVPRAEP